MRPSSNLRLNNSNNHEHHNDTSMDSNSNLSAELLASTPVEKCSLNTRRGKNADAPKRQLLTGYIIYASEVRKQVIDKNPNQNFGDISRLVGNEWKALPNDIRSKYDQRALIHNKRVRERAQLDPLSADDRLNQSTNGLHTPKMTKRKLAKLAKEQMRQHHLSIIGHGDLSMSSPGGPNSPYARTHTADGLVSNATSSPHQATYNHHHPHNHLSNTPQSASHPAAAAGSLTSGGSQALHSKTSTTESATQTTFSRFVDPPARKRLVYSDTFRRYIEGLQVPNKETLAEETTPDGLPQLVPSTWLGAGLGRHESAEAALWALRDFMLQDAVTMRRSMEPYL